MNRRTFLAVGAATAAAALIPMPAFAATSSYQDAFQRSPGPVTDPPQSPQIHYNVTGMGMPMIENGRVAPTAEGKCYLPFDFLVQPTLVGMDFTLAGSYDPSLPAGQLGGGVTIALGDGKHKSDPSKNGTLPVIAENCMHLRIDGRAWQIQVRRQAWGDRPFKTRKEGRFRPNITGTHTFEVIVSGDRVTLFLDEDELGFHEDMEVGNLVQTGIYLECGQKAGLPTSYIERAWAEA